MLQPQPLCIPTCNLSKSEQPPTQCEIEGNKASRVWIRPGAIPKSPADLLDCLETLNEETVLCPGGTARIWFLDGRGGADYEDVSGAMFLQHWGIASIAVLAFLVLALLSAVIYLFSSNRKSKRSSF